MALYTCHGQLHPSDATDIDRAYGEAAKNRGGGMLGRSRRLVPGMLASQMHHVERETVKIDPDSGGRSRVKSLTPAIRCIDQMLPRS